MAPGIKDWISRLVSHTRPEPTEIEDDEDTDVDPYNPFPEPVEIELTDIFDLHTIHLHDVKRALEEYLHQAHKSGFKTVRIIHGKGIGVQREIARSMLSRLPYVYDWNDAPPEAGGLGATIVRFRNYETADIKQAPGLKL